MVAKVKTKAKEVKETKAVKAAAPAKLALSAPTVVGPVIKCSSPASSDCAKLPVRIACDECKCDLCASHTVCRLQEAEEECYCAPCAVKKYPTEILNKTTMEIAPPGEHCLSESDSE